MKYINKTAEMKPFIGKVLQEIWQEIMQDSSVFDCKKDKISYRKRYACNKNLSWHISKNKTLLVGINDDNLDRMPGKADEIVLVSGRNIYGYSFWINKIIIKNDTIFVRGVTSMGKENMTEITEKANIYCFNDKWNFIFLGCRMFKYKIIDDVTVVIFN